MSEEQSLQISDRPSYIGMIVALPFLLLPFLAYAFLSLRHGHAKSLLCYLASFFVEYLFYVITSYVPHNQQVSSPLCISLVLVLIYFIFAKFFWMNVLCFDSWRHIGDAAGFFEDMTVERQQRFWLYSAYAWSIPLFLTLFIFAISNAVAPHTWYNPGLADEVCWLDEGVPIFIYLYLPITITIIIDVVFLTLIRRRLKGSDDGGNERGITKKMKYKFMVYMQIFSVLFLVWLIEIITWIIIYLGGSAPIGYWYFMEVFNALIGIAMFVICIFKKILCMLAQKRFLEIRQNWRKRYYMGSPRRDEP